MIVTYDQKTKVADDMIVCRVKTEIAYNDNHAENDNNSAAEHSLPPAILVGENSLEQTVSFILHSAARASRFEGSKTRTYSERSTSDATDGVHGKDERDLDTSLAGVKDILKVVHVENRRHERAVVAISASAAECDKDGKVELEGLPAPAGNVGLLNGGEELGVVHDLGLGTLGFGRVAIADSYHGLDRGDGVWLTVNLWGTHGDDDDQRTG